MFKLRGSSWFFITLTSFNISWPFVILKYSKCPNLQLMIFGVSQWLSMAQHGSARRLLWATGTYPGRRAPWGAWRMAIFDHHWAMMSPRMKPGQGVEKEVLPYSMVRYPSEAPSSVEILPWLVGWHGCLTDVSWETPGGAQLRFHDGELVFYPGDGQGNKDDPIWRSGTKGIGKELCFAEEGDLPC